MRRFLRDNGLSLMAFGLFGVFLVGQAVAGYEVYQRDLEAHGQPAIDFAGYLLSGHFIEATFENWESEFLQMGALVLLSVYLYQKGSPESKDPDADEEVDRQADPSRPGAPAAVRSNGIIRILYENSLGLALLGVFALSLTLHVLGGVAEYNREQEAHGAAGISALAFVGTPEFWFQSMQNWQSEFLSVGALVVLAIFLRQRGSPESKPVDEPDSTTGEV